jgi:hypothetical protein
MLKFCEHATETHRGGGLRVCAKDANAAPVVTDAAFGVTA